MTGELERAPRHALRPRLTAKGSLHERNAVADGFAIRAELEEGGGGGHVIALHFLQSQ